MLKLSASVLLGLAAAAGCSRSSGPVEVAVHRDGVLGTSLDVTIHAPDRAQGHRAVEAAIAEIARLDRVLSSYAEDSDLARLNRDRTGADLDAHLVAVVASCEEWLVRSAGKFSCRLGAIRDLWQHAEAVQTVPDRAEVRRQARDIARAAVRVDENARTAALGDGVSLDPSGVAKGYIIDRALEAARSAAPAALAIRIDIGGDAAYWGRPPTRAGWNVGVPDPNDAADNADPLDLLRLERPAGVAASGHVLRAREIGRRRFSHILDPRDGWPAYDAPGAVVVAPDAESADAVATALSTQMPAAGLDWVETLPGIEALIVTQDGRQLRSSGWSALTRAPGAAAGGAGAFEVLIEYTLPEIEANPYRRPYVAIWISDADDRPLRTLLLLGESANWARENVRWWRSVGGDERLLDGLARPTRRAGTYTVRWDGRDDYGVPVAPGTYFVDVEAAREHGGHEHERLTIEIGRTGAGNDSGGEGIGSVTADAEGSVELGAIRVTVVQPDRVPASNRLSAESK